MKGKTLRAQEVLELYIEEELKNLRFLDPRDPEQNIFIFKGLKRPARTSQSYPKGRLLLKLQLQPWYYLALQNNQKVIVLDEDSFPEGLAPVDSWAKHLKVGDKILVECVVEGIDLCPLSRPLVVIQPFLEEDSQIISKETRVWLKS